MPTDGILEVGADEDRYSTHLFEVAVYIMQIKEVRPSYHGYKGGEPHFEFPISVEQGREYEADFLVSESKRFDDGAHTMKKMMKGPRKRGGR
jgi:hypothetical protein